MQSESLLDSLATPPYRAMGRGTARPTCPSPSCERAASRHREHPPVGPQRRTGVGTTANNGDIVLLLDHSRFARDEADRVIARTWLLVAKNRHRAVGEIPIEWNYRTLQVREALQDEEHLWPGMRAA